MKVKTLLFLVTILNLFALGCITPPREVAPTVVSQKEFNFIKLLNDARDNALAGRIDVAEKLYRTALRQAPNLDGIYNDLGFVLMQQGRLREASELFKKALLLNPSNIPALDNLSQVTYREGSSARALKYYEELIDQALINQGLTQQSVTLAPWYRNVSIIYYKLGFLDEALCHSREAVLRAKTGPAQLVQYGLHMRQLLSLNRVGETRFVAEQVATLYPSQVPGSILIDHALSLYALGERENADQILIKILALPNQNYETRRNANLLSLAIAFSAKRIQESKHILNLLLEEDPDLCQNPSVDKDGYFPDEAVKSISLALSVLCSDSV